MRTVEETCTKEFTVYRCNCEPRLHTDPATPCRVAFGECVDDIVSRSTGAHPLFLSAVSLAIEDEWRNHCALNPVFVMQTAYRRIADRTVEMGRDRRWIHDETNTSGGEDADNGRNAHHAEAITSASEAHSNSVLRIVERREVLAILADEFGSDTLADLGATMNRGSRDEPIAPTERKRLSRLRAAVTARCRTLGWEPGDSAVTERTRGRQSRARSRIASRPLAKRFGGTSAAN